VTTEKQATTAERIAQAALELLMEGGSGAVTMRRVAAAVGVTPMAIYHHYPNREALLVAATEQEFEALRGVLEGRRTTGLRGAELVVEMLLGYVDYALERPRVFRYLFNQPRPGARRFPDDFRGRQSPTLTLLADEVEAEMAAGRMKADDEWAVALQLWALVHGYAEFYLGGRMALEVEPFRALVRAGLRRTLDGLLA